MNPPLTNLFWQFGSGMESADGCRGPTGAEHTEEPAPPSCRATRRQGRTEDGSPPPAGLDPIFEAFRDELL